MPKNTKTTPHVPKKEIEIKSPEKQRTAFNEMVEAELIEAEKLPIDKLIDIADKKGLFPEEQTREQKWKTFIEGIHLSDILKDCLQSSFNNYCTAHNKLNPEDNLQLKLHIRKKRELKTGQIFGVELVLEMRKTNFFTVVHKNVITFKHVRELKDEAAWRYALYGKMFQEIVNGALTLTLMKHDAGRTEQATTGTNTVE